MWESDFYDVRAVAKVMCGLCPVLEQCRSDSSNRKWGHGVVIAGWEAPSSTSGTMRYPPWR